MGKKGSWFSAIKRAFTHNSKEKLVNEQRPEKKNVKKKKWGLGKLRHGENASFVPFHGEPSSIEKILGDAEREQLKTPTMPSNQQRLPSDQQKPASLASMVVHHQKEINTNPIPTPMNYHIAAMKIQAVYRGYMARRSFRALRGLVRLQGVVRGQSVRRQTMNAMKYMQLLVKVQSQIQTRRMKMLENQALHRHNHLNNSDKDLDSNFARWTFTTGPSETGQEEEWDYSLLTKEEIEARMQRKAEGSIKRERALAYANSHQWLKSNPTSAQSALMEIRSGGFPWWWTWIERQLPENLLKNNLTPPRLPVQESSPRPQSSNPKQQPRLGFNDINSLTPTSSKSAMNNTKPKINKSQDFSFNITLRDDESLTSCPPFSVPNYMTPTVSAKAKARAYNNPKEGSLEKPIQEQKRRLSFPLTGSIGSIRWNRASLFSSKDSTSSQRILGKHKPLHSTGNLSVDSATSLPAGVGRKPFNRFV